MRKISIHLIFAACAVSFLYFGLFKHSTLGSDIAKRLDLLTKAQPVGVMVGDSTLRAGVDEELLSELVQSSWHKAFSNGSSSLWWYLYVKNVLSQSSHKPEIVLIFFRDHFLTEPTFRISGEYARPIRQLCKNEEPEVKELLLGNDENFWDTPLQYIPQEAKTAWEYFLLKTAAKINRMNKDLARDSLRELFDESKMCSKLITEHQIRSETVQNHESYDFNAKLPNSFLPLILKEIQHTGKTAVFVRMKRRSNLEEQQEPQLEKYIEALKVYLASEKAHFWDFSNEEKIQLSHFGPGDHLNLEGQKLFTQLLAERIKSHLLQYD